MQSKLLAEDFWSGARAPLSHALLCYGWTVDVYDIELGRDLASDQQNANWARRHEFLASACACPCNAPPKAREKRLAYSKDGGLAQLRSEQCPQGLPGLTPTQQERVDTDTALAYTAAAWAQRSQMTSSH